VSFFSNSSSNRAVFEDEPADFSNSSSNRAVFENEPADFSNSSSNRAVFEDEPADFPVVAAPSLNGKHLPVANATGPLLPQDVEVSLFQ
jgi:hypothetical protein